MDICEPFWMDEKNCEGERDRVDVKPVEVFAAAVKVDGYLNMPSGITNYPSSSVKQKCTDRQDPDLLRQLVLQHFPP
uniref:Ovule protein n=1 Tax=Syphacia muris TaxID=451379 RepID=A0A0N5AD63_9BILA